MFDDVLFTPISIWHLIDELVFLIENKIENGVYHIVSNEPVSKYKFGLELLKSLQMPKKNISKGKISDFEYRAGRSVDQTLDSLLYSNITSRKLPNFVDTISSIRINYEK